MSAVPAERLRDPEQIYSPEFPPHLVEDIVGALTEEGGQAFFTEVAAAMEESRRKGDLRPLNEVYEAWYRTLIFISDPKAEAYWEIAQADTSPGLTATAIRAKRLRGQAAAQ